MQYAECQYAELSSSKPTLVTRIVASALRALWKSSMSCRGYSHITSLPRRKRKGWEAGAGRMRRGIEYMQCVTQEPGRLQEAKRRWPSLQEGNSPASCWMPH